MSADRCRMDVPAAAGAGTSGRPGGRGSPCPVLRCTASDGPPIGAVPGSPQNRWATTGRQDSSRWYLSNRRRETNRRNVLRGRTLTIGRRWYLAHSLEWVINGLTNGYRGRAEWPAAYRRSLRRRQCTRAGASRIVSAARRTIPQRPGGTRRPRGPSPLPAVVRQGQRRNPAPQDRNPCRPRRRTPSGRRDSAAIRGARG